MFMQFFVALVVILCARVLWMRWKYDIHKIPSPPEWPLLGHTLLFLGGSGAKEITYVRAYWWKRLGWPKIIRLNFFGRMVLFVRDMDFAKSVLLSKRSAFPKITIGSAQIVVGGGSRTKNLFNITNTTPFVRAVRQCFLTAFDTTNLKLAVPMTHNIIDQMIDCIEADRGKAAIDVQQLCTRLTLDIIGRVALDINAGGLDGSRDLHRHMIEVGYIAVEQEVNPLKQLYCTFFPFAPMSRLRRKTINDLSAEWDRVTEEILSRDDPPQGEMPLWHGLRTLMDPDNGKTISYKNLRAEVATVVATGMDTTGHQLAWILALLASHPRVVENILEELKDKGLSGSGVREIRLEQLADLSYLCAVVKEGMRVCDVINGTFARVTTKDMNVLGYRVPPGTEIALASNRWIDAEDDWKNPKEFRPERWLNGEDTSHKHYLGFSHGPRDCVGQRLALLELRLTVIHLVYQYTLSLTIPFGDLMMRARNSLVTEAMDGIWIKMHPRMPRMQ